MKKGYTHVAFLLDRSGSMDSIKSDTIGGFNSFINDQKEDDTKCTFTMVQFDNEYEVLHDFKDIQKVKNLTKNTYKPRGSTALLDALGNLIVTTGEKLLDMDENDRPEKVLFIILTDGLENASKEYTTSQIMEMIKHQEEKYNWKFVYLGANQDAIKEASKFGIDSINTLTFAYNEKGIKSSYATLSNVVIKTRDVSASAYTCMDTIEDEDREAQEEAMTSEI
jgi:uncharacterized protein YegL